MIAKYLPKQRQWQSDPLPICEGTIRIFNDSLFIYTKSKVTSKVWRHKLLNFPQFFDKDLFQDKSLGGIGGEEITDMSIRDVAHIGLTEIIFLGRDDLDSYTILSASEACSTFKMYPNQFGSPCGLVTAFHEEQVLVLQENGYLWSVRACDRLPEIKIKQELCLWTRRISLKGAVLYNNELIVVGDFSHQSELSAMLDCCLPDVFQRVRTVQSCRVDENDSSGVALAVLPKSILK